MGATRACLALASPDISFSSDMFLGREGGMVFCLFFCFVLFHFNYFT